VEIVESEDVLFKFRIYHFDNLHQAEEFASLFKGTARAGKEPNGKWAALLY
jgi:hypothetical protein